MSEKVRHYITFPNFVTKNPTKIYQSYDLTTPKSEAEADCAKIGFSNSKEQQIAQIINCNVVFILVDN